MPEPTLPGSSFETLTLPRISKEATVSGDAITNM
jgi:hypothetical protein